MAVLRVVLQSVQLRIGGGGITGSLTVCVQL